MLALRSAQVLVAPRFVGFGSRNAAAFRQPSCLAVARFSSECEPAQKLRCIFEDYRKENFSRELPSRFKKELLKGASIPMNSPDASVEVERLNVLLRNIGREGDCLSREELDVILDEAMGGHERRELSVEKVLQLL
jgi:hypothetical protein